MFKDEVNLKQTAVTYCTFGRWKEISIFLKSLFKCVVPAPVIGRVRGQSMELESVLQQEMPGRA